MAYKAPVQIYHWYRNNYRPNTEQKSALKNNVNSRFVLCRSILRNLSPPVEYDSSYDKIRPLIESHPDFNGLSLESERVRVFKEYTTALEEACSHHHGRSKKSKKNTKHKRKYVLFWYTLLASH